MSDSDWGAFIKNRAGLIAVFGVATVLAIVVFEIAWLEQRDLSKEASRNSEHYARYAKDQIALECGVLTGQARLECAREIDDTARQNQREEYDLYSQRAMALWTAVMGGMAVVGVWLSSIGVYLIWKTWQETKITAESFSGAERARIILTLRARIDKNVNFFGTPTLTNMGNSAAYIERIFFCWNLAPEVSMLEFDPRLIIGSDFIIDGKKSHSDFPDAFFCDNNEENRIFMHGSIHYRDIFGGSHIHFFCYYVFAKDDAWHVDGVETYGMRVYCENVKDKYCPEDK